MSGRELARRAGISSALVSAIETDRSTDPLVSTVLQLARELGVSLDELVRGRAA